MYSSTNSHLKPQQLLIKSLAKQMNRELNAYNKAHQTKLVAKPQHTLRYGDAIVVYYQNQSTKVYTITKYGAIVGNRVSSFLYQNAIVEDICCKYLCKLIRSFD